MVGTPEYKLAKYLDNLIKPHIPDTYLLKSTDDFIERLEQFPCNNSYHIVSFDVVSLFTNVPLSETIELIINRLYADGIPYAIPFDKDVFRKFLSSSRLFLLILSQDKPNSNPHSKLISNCQTLILTLKKAK